MSLRAVRRCCWRARQGSARRLSGKRGCATQESAASEFCGHAHPTLRRRAFAALGDLVAPGLGFSSAAAGADATACSRDRPAARESEGRLLMCTSRARTSLDHANAGRGAPPSGRDRQCSVARRGLWGGPQLRACDGWKPSRSLFSRRCEDRQVDVPLALDRHFPVSVGFPSSRSRSVRSTGFCGVVSGSHCPDPFSSACTGLPGGTPFSRSGWAVLSRTAPSAPTRRRGVARKPTRRRSAASEGAARPRAGDARRRRRAWFAVGDRAAAARRYRCRRHRARAATTRDRLDGDRIRLRIPFAPACYEAMPCTDDVVCTDALRNSTLTRRRGHGTSRSSRGPERRGWCCARCGREARRGTRGRRRAQSSPNARSR